MFKYKVFGKGVAVVFLHGFMGNIDSFFGIASALSVGAKVLLIDFGFYDDMLKPLTLEDYVKGVREILNREGISDAYFVTHSFGTRVGVRMAKDYPQYFKGLVIIDGAGLKPRRGLKIRAKLLVHKLLKRFGKKGLKGSKDFRNLSANMKKTFISVVNDHCDQDLKYITFKVLLLWGSKDRDTPLYMARRFKKGLKNAELIVFKGASHFSYLDCHFQTLNRIKDFISSDV